ncbi:MAG: hypothetical protein JRN58_01845 [Nitrososphaerota archaeon]|nr:hypothetical protein [Nitrososphaerota archaeon]
MGFSERRPPHLGQEDWSSSTLASILAGLARAEPTWPALLPDFLYRPLGASAFASMLLATTADTVVSSEASFASSSATLAFSLEFSASRSTQRLL